MGAYATTTSLKQRYSGFPQSNTAADTVLSDSITRAEGVINSYICRRYSTPFTSGVIPPIIITITEDLSAAYAYRSSFMRDSHNTSSYQIELEKKSIDMLKLIRDSEIDIADTSGNLIGERGDRDRIKSNTEDYTPIFGLDDDTAWAVDSDRLDDIANARK